MSIKEFGVVMTAAIHLTSEKAGQDCVASYEFGTNKAPTVDEIQQAIDESIKSVNKALKVKDTRLTTLRDKGFAEMESSSWPPKKMGTP